MEVLFFWVVGFLLIFIKDSLRFGEDTDGFIVSKEWRKRMI